MTEMVYDLAIIGGGPGGYPCAIKAAQLNIGNIVCIDQRERLGGTCLNVGCIPSKALLKSTLLAYKAQHKFKEHGIEFAKLDVNLKAMMGQKDTCMKGLGAGIDGLMKKNKITKVTGAAQFTGPGTLSVKTSSGEIVIKAKKIVIATGSQVSTLPGIAVDGKVVVTSTEALEFERAPAKLLVIGAGAIGLELSSVWARLGSDVTVVEYFSRIAPSADSEVSSKLKGYLEKQGIKFKVSTQVTKLTIKGSGALVELKGIDGSAQESMEVAKVIVAAGRKANTEGLSLDKAGVKLDDRGRVIVNAKFETNIAGVYAIGDVIAGPMLAHKAEEDGIALAEIFAGHHGHVDYNTVPAVIYTSPEIAMVGKTEDQLKEAGVAYKVGKFSFVANSLSVATLSSDGFIKVIVDAKTDEILGVHILHELAGELITPAVLGMNYRASSEDIAMSCFPHPGFGEALKEACMAAYSKAIHA